MALEEIEQNGTSARKAALMFNVPRSTLMDYLVRKKKGDQEFMLASYSVRQVLSPDKEKELADYLLKCSSIFHGLTTELTKRLAYEYATANHIKVPLSWQRDKSAGRDWLTGFLERQGNLSLRTPEATSLARMASFNRINVGVFQTKLEEVLLRYGFQESSIYNLDETGCIAVQKLPKVVSLKGSHQVGQVTSRERGELVTMVGIVCANENAIPPSFVFPRVRFDEARMMNGVHTACQGLAYPSGWMNSGNFRAVLEHFVLHTRCSKDHKVLLLMDNHESHLSVEGIDYARDNGIVILTLPPHTSNKLQPLDVSVFGPFKTFYNQGLNAWMLQHPGRPATIYDIAPIMVCAWDKAATPINVKSGFRHTGICPFRTMIFNDEDFASSYVTDRPDPSLGPSAGLGATQHIGPMTSQEANVSQTAEDLIQYSVAQTSIVSSSIQPAVKSPEQVRPFPKAQPRKSTTRGRKRGRCMIATDTPEKRELENKRCQSKKLPVARKMKFSCSKDADSGEEDSALMKQLTEELGQSSEDSNEEIDNTISNFVDKTPEGNDFVVIGLNPLKGDKVYYVGKLLSDMDEEGDFQVSYLRKSNKGRENKFYFPSEVDEASVSRPSIIGVLPEPISLNNPTKRQQRHYDFGFSFTGFNMR